MCIPENHELLKELVNVHATEWKQNTLYVVNPVKPKHYVEAASAYSFRYLLNLN